MWSKLKRKELEVRPQIFILGIAIFIVFIGIVSSGKSYSHAVFAINKTSSDHDVTPTSESGVSLTDLPPKPLVFTTDCSMMPCVALTFDDGPEPATTPRVLDTLERHGVKATFFVLGNKIGAHPELLRRMQADGFEIGNHSWGHPDFTKLTPEQMLQQINDTQAALSAAGVPAARFFRAPYGAQNDKVRATVPLPIVLWNTDPKDWHETNPQTLANNIESQVRPGSIIIMHDTQANTANALDDVITRLNRKYQLVTVSELAQVPADAHGTRVVY